MLLDGWRFYSAHDVICGDDRLVGRDGGEPGGLRLALVTQEVKQTLTVFTEFGCRQFQNPVVDSRRQIALRAGHHNWT